MLPLQEKASVLEHMLPEDPNDKEIVEFPEGQVVGGSTVISVYKAGTLIGSVSSLSPIPNVSGKYAATRMSTTLPIKERDVLRIVGRQYSFNSVIFIQYFGWMGHKTTGEPLTLSDKFYKVLAATIVGPNEPSDFHLYEKVCMDTLKEKK